MLEWGGGGGLQGMGCSGRLLPSLAIVTLLCIALPPCLFVNPPTVVGRVWRDLCQSITPQLRYDRHRDMDMYLLTQMQMRQDNKADKH